MSPLRAKPPPRGLPSAGPSHSAKAGAPGEQTRPPAPTSLRGGPGGGGPPHPRAWWGAGRRPGWLPLQRWSSAARPQRTEGAHGDVGAECQRGDQAPLPERPAPRLARGRPTPGLGGPWAPRGAAQARSAPRRKGPGARGRGTRRPVGELCDPWPHPTPAERPTVRGAAARPGCPPPRPRSATLASRLAGASARGYGAQPLLLGVASSSRSFILCCGPLSPPDNCDVSVPPGLSDAPSLLGFWWLRFSPIPLNRPQDEAAFIYSSRDAVISRPPELALHRCPRRPGLPLPRPAARGVRDRGYPRKEATQRKAVSVLHALF